VTRLCAGVKGFRWRQQQVRHVRDTHCNVLRWDWLKAVTWRLYFLWALSQEWGGASVCAQAEEGEGAKLLGRGAEKCLCTVCVRLYAACVLRLTFVSHSKLPTPQTVINVNLHSMLCSNSN
jgi:hypothetical protein